MIEVVVTAAGLKSLSEAFDLNNSLIDGDYFIYLSGENDWTDAMVQMKEASIRASKRNSTISTIGSTQLKERLVDKAMEGLEPLPPLICWLESTPLVSFEQSVEDFKDVIPAISKCVNSIKKIVQLRTYTGDLSIDERCAIYLYTMELPSLPDGTNGSLYFNLNSLLRKQDRKSLIPFLKYTKLLMKGLYTLPAFKGKVIYLSSL
jgi:hypothetical protein